MEVALKVTGTNGGHENVVTLDENDGDLSPSYFEDELENENIDYLEGITAEMFADDLDFSEKLVQDEPEVEPMPDAAYGLLGCSKHLLQPCGRVDDLPEEVLWQVLSLIPARDMYRSAVLVCRRWRNVIEDTNFMPYKKKYFRYMMREEATTAEVTSLLNQMSDTNPIMTHNLVIMMANHQFGKRVNPEKVLERVKKHRFYPQAEASLQLHIRNVPKCPNLQIENGPNPFAAMAVILLLSESVDDILALVDLLNGTMSSGAVTEYLSHAAMLLLAARRNKTTLMPNERRVQENDSFVSERLHYNVYYVLHLRENGPFSVCSSEDSNSRLQMTGEQQQILSHDIQKDHVMKIVAFAGMLSKMCIAGTGKTTTLIKYAEQRPHLRFLYVAFNKSVAKEASQRFPSNVDCKTINSLAYRDIGRRYQKKLAFNLNTFSLNAVLPKGRGGFLKAKIVLQTLQNFLSSVDPAIGLKHVPSVQVRLRGSVNYINESEKALYLEDAETIWMKMKDPKVTNVNGYFMTHDGYVKLWQLQNPKVCLSDQYDIIFLDEAQDCTPTIMDVLLHQKCGKILVGDPHQQIYTFRGAINALQTVEHTHIYYLTQSFRFGSEIAFVGASILTMCKNVEKILVGGRQKGGVLDEKSAQAQQEIIEGKSLSKGSTAILFRSNLGVFSEAVRLIKANNKCNIHFVGGVDKLGLSKIMDIWYLKQGNYKRIKDRQIVFFARSPESNYLKLKTYADITEDRDLEAKLCFVEKYDALVPMLVNLIKKHSEENMKNAGTSFWTLIHPLTHFILGTVHKAKGLEFKNVAVGEDFVKVSKPRHQVTSVDFVARSRVPSDEWNLLYVAVTRAKRALVITRDIRCIITWTGEYFLKSVPPLTGGFSAICSTSYCPNCVTPGAAFMMCKRLIKYRTGVSYGGPLCEKCVLTRVGSVAYLMTEGILSMA
nr:F-box DNA helicase 1-like [Nerophis lumbriciformis]